ncbi:chromate transporter [Undibacterium arcticum]|uniref:Chromate transporter n=1 Tax=Undibacterium arcticum TaxID=1762892 RepID=A0ABV7EVZ6_9BURK
METAKQTVSKPTYTLWQLALYFLKLGTWGFGGPVALVGYMRRDLVDARHWISDEDYKEGLALSQLAPGPLAAQLGIYLGFVHYRLLGATLTGIAFVLPSFLMVVALGWAYLHFGGLPWMQAVFYGVGAAVIGIIAISAQKLTVKSVRKDKLLWAIYLLLVAVTVITESEMAWLFLASGVLVWFLRAPPKWLNKSSLNAAALTQLPMTSAWLGGVDASLLVQIGVYFTKAGAFVFGSGLAIVPFLYGGLVTEHHWLTEKQFVDAVAVAMITPGPVVITVGFIGYLIAGLGGATIAALATFLPCFLVTVIAAPYFKKYGKVPGMLAFVDGITAAAIGAITGSVIVIAKRSIIDIPTALIAVITVALLWKFKKLQEPVIVAAAAVLGLIIYPLLKH